MHEVTMVGGPRDGETWDVDDYVIRHGEWRIAETVPLGSIAIQEYEQQFPMSASMIRSIVPIRLTREGYRAFWYERKPE